MTYFGILKTGATAIPIDPASTVDEIVAFAKAGEASAIVVSPKLAAENPELKERLDAAFAPAKENHPVGEAPPPLLRKEGSPTVWTFDEVFEIQTEIEEAKRNALLPAKIHSIGHRVADLYFGHDRNAKGGHVVA